MPEVSTVTRFDNYYFQPPHLQVSDEIKDIIVRNHIEPNYVEDIRLLFKGKRDWKLVGQVFETTSKALVALGGIVSFAAGFFDEYYLSFVAGAISTISLATLQFSSFGYKEAKKQSHELNTNLKKLKIDEVPVYDRNVEDNVGSSMRQYATSSVNAQASSYGPSYDPYRNQEILVRNMQEQFANQIQSYREQINMLEKENTDLRIKYLDKVNNENKEEKIINENKVVTTQENINKDEMKENKSEISKSLEKNDMKDEYDNEFREEESVEYSKNNSSINNLDYSLSATLQHNPKITRSDTLGNIKVSDLEDIENTDAVEDTDDRNKSKRENFKRLFSSGKLELVQTDDGEYKLNLNSR
jgi:hypothetical protein